MYWKKGKIMHAVKGRKAMDSSDYFGSLIQVQGTFGFNLSMVSSAC